ncbi:hypothetical protein SAMN05421788_107282 [Filimonas lacunae]|uniref:Uncharacterized protein n=1 Tax=Filimonas lacunae TaxID=477680 RepID=A0A173MG72_9BACT|nr:hypothetical protein [Filimonas lacunae]BAV06622.1 hypothetical protein FLA_2641 [Filimonas lacunae]SIT27624.1 hypothetical protein SAMN05421788_107282 [Filimonas lacunae]
MYNPLTKFKTDMLPGFANMKVRYLVAQQYYRGKLPSTEQLPLLLTDYPDLVQASTHYQNIKVTDKWAAIIDLQNPKHLAKLAEMCQPYSEYVLYAAFTDDPNKVNLKNDKRIANAAKSYIDSETNWKPTASATVKAQLELQFGELFVTFRLGGQQAQTRLSALETTKPCVTTSALPATYDTYKITFQASTLIRR